MSRLLETYGTGRKIRKLVIYLSVIAVVGMSAAAKLLAEGTFPKTSTVLLYALLGLIGQHLQVAFPQGNFITLGDPVAFTALWCFGIPSSLLVLVPASLIQFFTKKRGLLNCLFNAGQFALATLASGTAVNLLRRLPGSDTGLASIMMVMAMIAVFDAANDAFVAGAVAIDQELLWSDIFHRIAFVDRKNSLVLWYFVNISGVLLATYMGQTGTLFVFVGVFALWAQLLFERELARKSHEAQTDVLTGLLNVRYLEDWMGNEFPKIAGEERKCSLVFVDVDGLKEVNDTYGHDAGDALLVHLAGVLRSVTRSEDRVIRYGGDEFILICHKTDLTEATGIGQRVLEAIKKTPLVHEGRNLTYGVSVGVASFPRHTALGRDLVRMADKAMYLAKKHGGNMVYTADSL